MAYTAINITCFAYWGSTQLIKAILLQACRTQDTKLIPISNSIINIHPGATRKCTTGACVKVHCKLN